MEKLNIKDYKKFVKVDEFPKGTGQLMAVFQGGPYESVFGHELRKEEKYPPRYYSLMELQAFILEERASRLRTY